MNNNITKRKIGNFMNYTGWINNVYLLRFFFIIAAIIVTPVVKAGKITLTPFSELIVDINYSGGEWYFYDLGRDFSDMWVVEVTTSTGTTANIGSGEIIQQGRMEYPAATYMLNLVPMANGYHLTGGPKLKNQTVNVSPFHYRMRFAAQDITKLSIYNRNRVPNSGATRFTTNTGIGFTDNYGGFYNFYREPNTLNIDIKSVTMQYPDVININTEKDGAKITLLERIDSADSVQVSVTPVINLLSGDPKSVFITKNGQPGCSELLAGEHCELNVDTGILARGNQASGYVNLTLKVK